MHKLYSHTIELNPGTTLPKLVKLYLLNKHKCLSLDKWIAAKMKKGYIWPSKSPTAVPVFFMKKKDSSLHLVKTIDGSMQLQKRTTSQFLKFPTLWTAYPRPPYSPPWTYVGVSTTYRSKKETRKRQPSSCQRDFLNLLYCHEWMQLTWV
jgi:hypothetical protein